MMASHGSNFIRLRLHFDYPPPAAVDCRMCWLLVDLNASRVVADLESVIREKFDFSRGSILSLFIEDCYLPHTESIYVVRDNDSVRVKVDRLSHVNGGADYLEETGGSCRKRRRPTEEDGPEENGVSNELKKKKKKRKKVREQSVEKVEKSVPSNTGTTKHEKSAEKEKREKKKKKEKSTDPNKPDGPTNKKPLQVERTGNNKKSQISNVSSSDSSSSSEEDEPLKKTAAQKSAPKKPSSTPAPSKALSSSKPAQKKPPPPLSSSDSSSDEESIVKPPPKAKPVAHPTTKPGQTKTAPQSSSSDSSSDEESIVKPPPKTKPVAHPTTKPAQKKTAPPSSSSSSVSSSGEEKTVKPPPKTKPSAHTTPKAGRSHDTQTQQQDAPPQDQTQAASSEDEIPFIIHKPVQQPIFGGRDQSSWRGRGGRGKSWRGDPGERRKAESGGVTGGQNGCAELSRNGAKVPSYQTDSLTNTSVVFQNEAESAPKKDYSSMPLLAAPPKVGQRIAFKLLELTENYTPEVSKYKEGIIVSFDEVTQQIELELRNSSRAPVEPGKFDLVYQNADGTERVEYAVSRDSRVTERWASLLEPRLII